MEVVLEIAQVWAPMKQMVALVLYPIAINDRRMQVEVVKLGLAGLKEPSLVPAGNVVMNV